MFSVYLDWIGQSDIFKLSDFCLKIKRFYYWFSSIEFQTKKNSSPIQSIDLLHNRLSKIEYQTLRKKFHEKGRYFTEAIGTYDWLRKKNPEFFLLIWFLLVYTHWIGWFWVNANSIIHFSFSFKIRTIKIGILRLYTIHNRKLKRCDELFLRSQILMAKLWSRSKKKKSI